MLDCAGEMPDALDGILQSGLSFKALTASESVGSESERISALKMRIAPRRQHAVEPDERSSESQPISESPFCRVNSAWVFLRAATVFGICFQTAAGEKQASMLATPSSREAKPSAMMLGARPPLQPRS